MRLLILGFVWSWKYWCTIPKFVSQLNLCTAMFQICFTLIVEMSLMFFTWGGSSTTALVRPICTRADVYLVVYLHILFAHWYHTFRAVLILVCEIWNKPRINIQLWKISIFNCVALGGDLSKVSVSPIRQWQLLTMATLAWIWSSTNQPVVCKECMKNKDLQHVSFL